MLRVLPFLQHHPRDHQRAYPIDGLAAYVDLVERRVLHLIDHEVLPVPQEEGSFDDRPPSGRRGPRFGRSRSPSWRGLSSASTARGRRGRLEAQRPVHRLLRDPPHAPPGRLDLRRHRQLRLRLLLIPVPRRPDRAGDQDHRGAVHLGPCRGQPLGDPGRPRPRRPLPPAHVQRPARHDGRRDRQRRRRGGAGAPAGGARQPPR
jgi:hypothetical protein